MKAVTEKKKQPTIANTSCRTCGFNELIHARKECKTNLRTTYKEYRANIRHLADCELTDRCYVARLRELGNDPQWQDEIHRIKLLRNSNKRDRLACIGKITDLKHSIQRQLSVIRDFHGIIRDIYKKHNGEKYQDFKYNLRLTMYSDGHVKFDAVVLRPIQFVTVDAQPVKSVGVKFTPNIPDDSTAQ